KPVPITEFPVNATVSVVEIKGTPIVLDYFYNNGIEHYSILTVLPSEFDDKIVLKRDDGSILEINILDAKNIIGVKVEK
ncbi:MAG: MarR family winged helix-turn-helix transcriptional regulator, partial [Cetobacterium sp.]